MNNLSFQYPEQYDYVLKQVSFSVKEGEFIVLCGASGSGKTTLLRMLKPELAPYGKLEGDIFYRAKSISEWDKQTLASDIGFVFQNPDNQIVMDEVFQEIVFGMENINIQPLEMKKRLAELVHFFGVDSLLEKKVHTLSGGQKQTINLLSILLLRPKLLLLDEPTSQLDPVAARELLQILERLNKEMGMTIIIVEHRLEELFSMADKVIMLHKGTIAYHDTSEAVIRSVYEVRDERFLPFIPAIAQLYLEREEDFHTSLIPLNVKEGREWWIGYSRDDATESFNGNSIEKKNRSTEKNEAILSLNKVYFQYDKYLPYVLKNCSLFVKKGEFYSLVGGNGSGKSTLLQISMGVLRQQRGGVLFRQQKLKHFHKGELARQFAYLPQHPLSFYIEDTIGKEMDLIIRKHGIADGIARKRELSERLGISDLLNRHPNDISGGELQRATLACLLLQRPSILFIDEPTKGIDPVAKLEIGKLLRELTEIDLTIFMVTHDIQFAVQFVDRCAILFDGQITAEGTPDQIFKGNYFYTTSLNRATSTDYFDGFLTMEEALSR